MVLVLFNNINAWGVVIKGTWPFCGVSKSGVFTPMSLIHAWLLSGHCLSQVS